MTQCLKCLETPLDFQKPWRENEKYNPHCKQKACTARAACLCTVCSENLELHTFSSIQAYISRCTEILIPSCISFPEITFWGSLKFLSNLSSALSSRLSLDRKEMNHHLCHLTGASPCRRHDAWAQHVKHSARKSETQNCRGSRKDSQTGESIK